jgi:hypothetical protein
MEVGGQLHTLAAVSPEEIPQYPLNQRLCGCHSQSGCIREEKTFLFPQRIKLKFLGPEHSPITILAEPWSMDTHVFTISFKFSVVLTPT